MNAKCQWRASPSRLYYEGDNYSLLAEPGRGWVSLSVDNHEIFAAPPGFAGFVFSGKNGITGTFSFAQITPAPGRHLREAEVGDGIFVQRFHCREPARLRLYAGFNLADDHELLIFPAAGVSLIRLGRPKQYVASMETCDLRSRRPAEKEGECAVVVHESGAWLRLEGRIKVASISMPEVGRLACLVLPCRGFTGNEFDIEIGVKKRLEHWIASPRFSVSGGPPLPPGVSEPARGAGMPVFDGKNLPRIGVGCVNLDTEERRIAAEVEVAHMDGSLLERREDVKPVASSGAVELVGESFELSKPGAADVWGRLVGSGERLLWADHFRLVFDLEAYEPEDTRQDDYNAFWQSTLDEQKSCSLDLKEEARFERGGWELVEVSYNVLPPRRIHAMIFHPSKTDGNLPVIITAHPNIRGWNMAGRIHGSKVDIDRRFAWFVPLIRGHRPDEADIPFNHPWWGPMENRETYEGRYWFSTMARSREVLEALDMPFDLSRVVAKGGSQGGALALAAAALDPGLCLCLADCPSHCQLQTTVRPYPLLRSRTGQIRSGVSQNEAEKFLSYFDAANFCLMIRCPTVISHNIGDLTVHVSGGLAAYRKLERLPPEKKWLILGAGTEHENPPPAVKKMGEMLDAVAGGTLCR
ncbi:MAG: acetylxylan esterase [Kiritimatiellia bacterium]